MTPHGRKRVPARRSLLMDDEPPANVQFSLRKLLLREVEVPPRARERTEARCDSS